MSRAARAAACVVALAAIYLASGPVLATTLGVGSEAEAAACVQWKKHSKRVVKRVKRHGEVTTVAHWKHWRTCVRRATPPAPAPTPASTPVPVPPPAAPTAPAPEPEDPSIARLGVKSVEWSYTLSRPQIEAGPVIVELNNMGEDPHNLNLQREGGGPLMTVSVVGSGQQGKGKFDLAEGTYRMWCGLPEHDEKGMNASLVVGP